MRLSTEANATAALFPGQGEQRLGMFTALTGTKNYKYYLEAVSDLLSTNIRDVLSGDITLAINTNAISSLLTVTASTLYLERYLEDNDRPDFFGGYSVGQWMAISAATEMKFLDLAKIIFKRAQLMDECCADLSSRMMAVIGLHEFEVEQACEELRDAGNSIWISNYNAPGQFSLAMRTSSHRAARKKLQGLQPKRLIDLPVSGGWHSPLLEPARKNFIIYLEQHLGKLDLTRVINNVNGELFPAGDQVQQLGAHLSHPVRWEDGIRSLIAAGCQEFIEVGFGNQLTKFGFFIDRSRSHRTLG